MNSNVRDKNKRSASNFYYQRLSSEVRSDNKQSSVDNCKIRGPREVFADWHFQMHFPEWKLLDFK